jgi:hypothetical protein
VKDKVERSPGVARRAFLVLALLSWAMWIAIASGIHGERDSDSAAWITCFTFLAPASYALVLGRRSWSRLGVLQMLLLTFAFLAGLFELMTVAQSSGGFPRLLRPTADLPAAAGVPLFFLLLGSLFAAPLLSLLVFFFGRRSGAEP